MTREDIIRMAHEAGIDSWWNSGNDCREDLQAHLEHFSSLIAAAEREACAKGCAASVAGFGAETEWADGYIQAAKDIAEGIRARGDT